MTFADLMRLLLEQDVQLVTDGQTLHFDAPDGVVTDGLLDALRRHKSALISWLLTHAAPGETVTRALPPYIQQEWWQRARSHPHPAVYTIARRLHFSGRLDAAALRDALDWLVARHDPLRTRFSSYPDRQGEQAVQEVVGRLPLRLGSTDLTTLPENHRQAALDRHCADRVREPFALDRAPLWRVHLFTCGPDQHVLLWTLHHIICDGWSMATLYDDLLEAYAAARTDRRPDRPPIALTHADYARWQRRQLSGPHRERLVTFWRTELAGATLALALPYDRPPPARLSGRGAVHHFELGSGMLAGLQRAARDLHSTLYAVVLSAFAQLLSEITGQDDVVIPISHANRTRDEHETVVGLLADRIPIRIRLRDVSTFGELVRRVGNAVFAAMDHQSMPLSLLMSALPRHQRPPPPYPTVLFTLLDEPDQQRDLDDLTVTVRPDSPQGVARMQFYCFLSTSGDTLRGGFEYSTDLFDPATVAAWSSRFLTLLDRAGAPRSDARW